MGYRFEMIDADNVRIIRTRWWRDVEETRVRVSIDVTETMLAYLPDGTCLHNYSWLLDARVERFVRAYRRRRRALARQQQGQSNWTPVATLPKATAKPAKPR